MSTPRECTSAFKQIERHSARVPLQVHSCGNSAQALSGKKLPGSPQANQVGRALVVIGIIGLRILEVSAEFALCHVLDVEGQLRIGGDVAKDRAQTQARRE